MLFSPVLLLAISAASPALALPAASPNAAALPDPSLWDSIKQGISGFGTALSNRIDKTKLKYDNIDEGRQQKWMANIDGNKKLTEISIPGTHESMTYSKLLRTYTAGEANCQTYDLGDQFRGGIRYIDVRVFHKENHFELWHGSVADYVDFTEMLDDVTTFLKNNPTETVLLRHKQENDDKDCTRSYSDTYNDYRYQNKDTRDQYNQYAWKPSSCNPGWPTLNEVRGKFVVLMDWTDNSNSTCDAGIKYNGWGNAQMSIQDKWDVQTADIPAKLTAITDAMDQASQDTEHTKLRLNHLSASSTSVWPKPFALGSGDFSGANAVCRAKLNDLWNANSRGSLGIIAIDYPGKEIVDSILRFN